MIQNNEYEINNLWSSKKKKIVCEASYMDMEVQRPKEGDVQSKFYLQF